MRPVWIITAAALRLSEELLNDVQYDMVRDKFDDAVAADDGETDFSGQTKAHGQNYAVINCLAVRNAVAAGTSCLQKALSFLNPPMFSGDFSV